MVPPELHRRALHTRRWVKRIVTLMATICIWPSAGMAVDKKAVVAEYDLKAALVYRTAKFIEWPATAFAGTTSTFVLCVVGDNTAAASSFRALEAKTIGARAVSVRRITGDMLDVRQCHVAFFPADTADQISYAADKLAGAPVLTVGDNAAFVERGGMLALLMDPERVKFLVRLPAARQARLGVSSQLLQLATVIE